MRQALAGNPRKSRGTPKKRERGKRKIASFAGERSAACRRGCRSGVRLVAGRSCCSRLFSFSAFVRVFLRFRVFLRDPVPADTAALWAIQTRDYRVFFVVRYALDMPFLRLGGLTRLCLAYALPMPRLPAALTAHALRATHPAAPRLPQVCAAVAARTPRGCPTSAPQPPRMCAAVAARAPQGCPTHAPLSRRGQAARAPHAPCGRESRAEPARI